MVARVGHAGTTYETGRPRGGRPYRERGAAHVEG